MHNCKLSINDSESSHTFNMFAIDISIDNKIIKTVRVYHCESWQQALEVVRDDIDKYLQHTVGYGIINPETN